MTMFTGLVQRTGIGMQLLNETTAPAVITKLLVSASSAKIAVAFWGAGAIDLLGIDTTPSRKQVICNLESGACNPNEIRKLRSLPNIDLRTNARLHAKVYWSDHQAVIGSSNASTNGLVAEGQVALGWAEANILTTDPALLKQTGEWFDRLFAESQAISDDALTKAEGIWTQRRKIVPPTPKPKAKLDDSSSSLVQPQNHERLLRQFHEAMRRIYEDAKEAGHQANFFRDMLLHDGGYNTAIALVSKKDATSGFDALILLKRPDLTVEHLVTQEPWRGLFTPQFLRIAEDRLRSRER